MERFFLPVVTFAVLLYLFFSLSLTTSKGSIDKATLVRVKGIIDSCPEGAFDSNIDCIGEFSDRTGYPVDAILMDSGGNSVVVDSSGCQESDVKVPYSTGRNGVDECGNGDDIKLIRIGPFYFLYGDVF